MALNGSRRDSVKDYWDKSYAEKETNTFIHEEQVTEDVNRVKGPKGYTPVHKPSFIWLGILILGIIAFMVYYILIYK